MKSTSIWHLKDAIKSTGTNGVTSCCWLWKSPVLQKEMRKKPFQKAKLYNKGGGGKVQPCPWNQIVKAQERVMNVMKTNLVHFVFVEEKW